MSKLACNYCGSSDAGHQYDDGYYCFSCKHKTFNDDRKTLKIKEIKNIGLTKLPTLVAIASRKNSMLEKYNVKAPQDGSVLEDAQSSLYFKTMQYNVWHKRTTDKKCSFIGAKDSTEPCMFHLANPLGGGKTIVIVEDPISALKVVQSITYDVVALFGTHLSTINKCWLAMNFYSVYIWLDADKPGKIATMKIRRQLRDVFPNLKVIYHNEPKLCSEAEIILQFEKAL